MTSLFPSTSLLRQCRRFAVLLCCLLAGPAVAQDAPIRFLVGWAPGGQIDLVARLVAQGMQAELGRSVVVENRAGAGGMLAAQAMRTAPTDGSVLSLAISHTTAMVPLITLNPGFDPLKDFSYVAMVATNPNFFIVNTEVVGQNVHTLADFVAWAKAHPERANIGVPAPASAPEFTVDVMAQAFGMKAQTVPFRGEAPMMQSLLGGNLAAGLSGAASAAQYLATGKLKLLAVDGPTRLQGFPDIPTYGEVGIPGLEEVIFLGVIGPAGMPAERVDQYNAIVNRIVASDAFKARTSELGIVPLTGTPAEMAKRTQSSLRANAALVKAAGFSPQ